MLRVEDEREPLARDAGLFVDFAVLLFAVPDFAVVDFDVPDLVAVDFDAVLVVDFFAVVFVPVLFVDLSLIHI